MPKECSGEEERQEELEKWKEKESRVMRMKRQRRRTIKEWLKHEVKIDKRC